MNSHVKPTLALRVTWFAGVLLATLGVASSAPAGPTLVIVGGGLDPDHRAVYQAVLDHIGPTGRLGVLPTASGVPDESGPLTVDDFKQYAGPDQTIELLDLRHDTPELAHDSTMVARLAACDGLWFTGGVQSRIVKAFRPSDGDSPAYDAIRDLLDRGGVVGGTSAGAAMMSDPMIYWGTSHEAMLLGEVDDVGDFGVAFGRGMGLLPDGLVDQHFFRRGRLGRLLVAAQLTRTPLGFGIGENCAMVIDLDSLAGRVIGDPGVLAVRLVTDRVPDADDSLVAAFQARYWPGGTSFSLQPDDARPTADDTPSVEFIQDAIAGSPRSYAGPLVVDVTPQRLDTPIDTGFGDAPAFVLRRNAAFAPARQAARLLLAEKRVEQQGKPDASGPLADRLADTIDAPFREPND
jgi:cyanophycinase